MSFQLVKGEKMHSIPYDIFSIIFFIVALFIFSKTEKENAKRRKKLIIIFTILIFGYGLHLILLIFNVL